MKLICDSGSTKSAWCLTDGTTHTYYITDGINPYQQTDEEITNIISKELKPQITTPLDLIGEVYFFGAGCNKEKSPLVANIIRNQLTPKAKITVDSDMLGAAIALCGKESGVVCILGTGSNSAYYDGNSLKSYIPALGYILGDEGSGAYIGKRLVGDILKCQFSEEVRSMFFIETNETQATIIQNTYREPLPNRYLANLSLFCANHKDNSEIHSFLIKCFNAFFERNIIPMTQMLEDKNPKINFAGSIAYYYQEEIEASAHLYGYEIGKIIKAPIEGLVTNLL